MSEGSPFEMDDTAESSEAALNRLEAAELLRGAELGRYIVLGKLGAGGMGVVYAAYDPELDRKVALKILRTAPADEGSSDDDGRTRMLREAQALARLSHPNVVAVHDVGAVGRRVWLAMEFVEGRTFDSWCKETFRSWREIVQVMAQAGEGLAAAHGAGLVHRDFKPENVMVSRDGRVRARSLRRSRRYEEGLSAAQSALSRAEQIGWLPLVAEARFQVGDLLESTGRYTEAEMTTENAYFEAVDASAVEVAADAALGLVWIVGERLARHADGRRWSRLADAAIRRFERTPGLSSVRSRSLLANLYESMGSYPEARALYEEALSMYEDVVGTDHPEIAVVFNNLSILQRKMGSAAEAEAALRRALAIKERVYGSDHPTVATSFNNLANVLKERGAYAEARALYQRALSVYEQVLGPDHTDVAATLDNLANVHKFLGEHREALELHMRALSIRERALGTDHPDVAHTYVSLAHIYDDMGDRARAREFFEQALPILERTLGRDHPDVARSLGDLAVAYRIAGEYERSRELHERALGIRIKSLGPEHREVGYNLANIAIVYHVMGRPVEAKGFYERAQPVLEKTLGDDHPDVAWNLSNYAEACIEVKAYAEARAAIERATRIIEKTLGTEHRDFVNALVNLAKVHLAEKALAEAARKAQQAVELGEKASAPADLLVDAHLVLARAYWDLAPEEGGDRMRARTFAEQARDILVTTGREGPKLDEVQRWLVDHKIRR